MKTTSCRQWHRSGVKICLYTHMTNADITQATNRNTLYGALSVLIAVLFFSMNDTSIKFLSGGYALHQIVLIRSVIGLGIVLAILMPMEGNWRLLKTKRLGLHLIRGMCVVLANMTFFIALAVLPLADAIAVFFVSPLLITAFSVMFLGEKAGIHRWSAVGIGLVGVVIMLRPGTENFNLIMILPLLSAAAYAMLHVLTRKIGVTESAVTMTFYIQISFIVTCVIIGVALGHGRWEGQGPEIVHFLLRAWYMPPLSDWWIFGIIGLASGFGGYFISQGYRLAEASVVAPLEYVAMPVSVIAGLLIFDEWPDPVAWLGITLIIGAGLYVFWRETVNNVRLKRRSIRR